jgi:hypothetical protein
MSLLLVACGGGSDVPKNENDVKPVATTRPTGPKLAMQSEFGVIDENAAKKVIVQLTPTIQRCHTSNLKRVEYLAGDIKFYIRIGDDGRAKWTYLEESNLGDREAERCIVDALGGATWPKPEGGPQAELRSSFGFDAPGDVRAPYEWSADKVAAVIGKHMSDLDKCTEGTNAKFKITAYVEPDGKNGKVQAVGVATSSEKGADKVDCVVDAVKKMKMPSPGSYAVKVSFAL